MKPESETKVPPLLSIEAARKMLGLGRFVADKAVRDGSLPTIKIGTRRYVRRTDIDAIIGHEADDPVDLDRKRAERDLRRLGLDYTWTVSSDDEPVPAPSPLRGADEKQERGDSPARSENTDVPPDPDSHSR
jgi:hypothetical protein